jgi:hypothetical protein
MNISTSPIETNDTRPAPAKATKPATANVIIDLNLIAQLRKDIAKIGTDSAEGITKRQAIILLLPEITAARARKVSFKAIEAALKARGILISAATIGTYWRQAMADIEAAKPKPLKPAPEPIPAPEIDIASLEQTLDDVNTPSSSIVFHSLEDIAYKDDEDFLRKTRARNHGNESVEK